MKYIRTKDKRIAAIPNKSKLVLYDNEKLVIDTTKKGRTCVYGIVEKIADTIEELFDEYILISGTNRNCNPFLIEIKTRPLTGTKEVVFSDDSGHHSIVYHLKQDDAIYGAVWTNKGLIKKAKINRVLPNGEIEWKTYD